MKTVWEYYTRHGRHDLPWRQSRFLRPYPILVSELMLQQTQVQRVQPKFLAFMQRWPSLAQLAAATQGEVLRAWQGLGYNRRARYLHQLAQTLRHSARGRFPRSEDGLRQLPGIGPYTAAAVCAFAYQQPTILIETNVRQVYLQHFFAQADSVTDQAIAEVLQRTIPADQPREWYWALMDYGSYLKRTEGNLVRRSRHYRKQSRFVGSDREIRGAILRAVSTAPNGLTSRELCTQLSPHEQERVKTLCAKLKQEGLLQHVATRWRL